MSYTGIDWWAALFALLVVLCTLLWLDILRMAWKIYRRKRK